jgi:hypothetical protein
MTDAQVHEDGPQVTPFRVWSRLVAANAFLLSLLYLGLGLGAELLRHAYPTRTVSRLLMTLEQTPGRALEAVGLMDVLRQAYLAGAMESFGLRWAYGLTMMVIIFVTAVGMAALMALVQWVWVRQRRLDRSR